MSDDDNVTKSPSPDIESVVGSYQRSRANIRRLSELLPEELVQDLAREVILRVASKEPLEGISDISLARQDLETLCDALISDDESAAAKIIFDMQAEGMKPKHIYFKKLAAAARLLGEKWESDDLSFSEVTVGTVRIFAIMRSMRHLFETDALVANKTAVFASVPGEDHTLGVHMAADVFRKDGWEIELCLGMKHDELIEKIENSSCRLIGLSVGGEHSVDALSRLIVSLQISLPHAIVVVSGSGVEHLRPILNLMELDGIAETLEDAQKQIAALWEERVSA